MLSIDHLHGIRKRTAPFPCAALSMTIVVSISDQMLFLVDKEECAKTYPISTSRFGVGNAVGSFKTPLGVHRIIEKIGYGLLPGAIFTDRIFTGRYWDPSRIGDNMILSRIMRLQGLEQGLNKGEGIDSYERYIYIHGTANEPMIGKTNSHGCICMRNSDVVDLFERVLEGTLVIID